MPSISVLNLIIDANPYDLVLVQRVISANQQISGASSFHVAIVSHYIRDFMGEIFSDESPAGGPR